MHIAPAISGARALKTQTIACDLAVVGGGISGVCAAIAAAREGLAVTLIQDRPVLGGNASSEVRLWILGATSHMGNNNRWAREGGIVDEFMVENLRRNPEGNPVLVDALLLDMVRRERNITLLLNTVVHDLEKSDASTIRSVRAFNPQNATAYMVNAPFFCDASGDGIVGFLAGAAFRMGAERAEEFGEGMAPGDAYGELLGHSLYFYTRDTGKPVTFVPPDFALKDITKIPRYRHFNTAEHGCKLWWIEHGGRLDTVHDTEEIKWELWQIVYGVWNHIKNSGQFPDAANLTLEWVGLIAGKRESRRFEGDYLLTQRDLIDQIAHPDDVSHGGWAIDLHPADGVYSQTDGCTQYHAKGVYGIPYRTMYSRNIKNLFLAGRIISASHVAYGSTRVMATCGQNAQAVGLAAALCKRQNCLPADIARPEKIGQLQRALLRQGQYIPAVPLRDPENLAQSAALSASGEFRLATLPANGQFRPLKAAWAMMLPLAPGPVPRVVYTARAQRDTTVRVQLRLSSKAGNHTPDTLIAEREVPLPAGESELSLDFDDAVETAQYGFFIVCAAPDVALALSDHRVSGVLALSHAANPAVAKSAVQRPPQGSGVDSFEFWLPRRRPDGQNFAVTVEPPLGGFGVENIRTGVNRPVASPNAWVADLQDKAPHLDLVWGKPQSLRRIVLCFDTDFDHPMESVQMGHPERTMPFCVADYRITDEAGNVLVEVTGNYQTRREHVLHQSVRTRRLRVELAHPKPDIPAALFDVRLYAH